MTLPRHQRERDARQAAAVKTDDNQHPDERDLPAIEAEIENLEQTLAGIEANQQDLADASAEAARALTGALRRYGSDPNDSNQRTVDKAEERAAAARKREHTARASTKVLKGDLQTLRTRRNALVKEQAAANRAQAMAPLKEELTALRETMRENTIRYIALRALTEGVPTGSGGLSEFNKRDLRIEAEAMVAGIREGWAHD